MSRSNGLEPRDRLRLKDTLTDLARSGAAILVTGHEVEDLLEIADEVTWIVAGGTYSLGDAAAARHHHQFRREYLGGRLRKGAGDVGPREAPAAEASPASSVPVRRPSHRLLERVVTYPGLARSVLAALLIRVGFALV